MIRTIESISPSATQYYFEFTVNEQGETGEIGIGLTRNAPETRNGGMPGWDDGTIGYHGDDGGIYHNSGRKETDCETFGSGDTVGCALNRIYIDNASFLFCYFTKNGKKLNPVKYLEDGDYYPTIGMGSAGTVVTANLGENDFLYNSQGIFINILLIIIDFKYDVICFIPFIIDLYRNI